MHQICYKWPESCKQTIIHLSHHSTQSPELTFANILNKLNILFSALKTAATTHVHTHTHSLVTLKKRMIDNLCSRSAMATLSAPTNWCSQPAPPSSGSCWRRILIHSPWSSSGGQLKLTMVNELLFMDFIFRIRFPDMVAILNFMYHGEVNVNQEDLQNFLAAAEELRIKGLSEASSTDAKLEKLEHSSVPKSSHLHSDTHFSP